MRSKTVLSWLLALLLIPASTLIGGHAWLQTADGKRWLAVRIETAVNTQDRQLSIGALGGAIPFSPEIADVGFSDSEGRWLTVDRAAIRFDPMALFDSEARFEVIEVGRVEMLRRPITTDSGTEDLSPFAFSWPDLPIPVNVERLSVDEVALDVSVLGESARFTVAGAARLGDPGTGLSLDLSIARTDDSPGNLSAQLRYVPDTQQLTTRLRLDEPEGGMLARLAGLTGLPAMTAELFGDGPLDDWRAEFVVDGGDGLNLDAQATIRAEEVGRRVTLEATGRLAAIAADALNPLLGAKTSLGGSVLVRADDRLHIDRFELVGAFGEASLTGVVDLPDETMDMALTLIPGPPDRFALLIDGASWMALGLSASLKGPFLKPALTLSISGDAVSRGDVAVESLDLMLNAVATGPFTASESSIDVAASILIEGLDPEADVPSALLGPKIGIEARGSVNKAGRVVVDSLTIDAPSARLSGQGKGEKWGVESASLVSILDVPELSRLAPEASRSLEGAATLELSADWDGTRASIRGSAEIERLSTGVAVADSLLGSAPRIFVEASLDTDGAVGIDSLELTGTGLLMWLSGGIGVDGLGIDWQLSLADLAVVAPWLGGSLAAAGRMTGIRDDPAATARLTLDEAVLAGHSISEVRLDADFAQLFTGPAGRIALSGQLAGLPARTTAELQVEKDGTVRIDELILGMASLAAEGALVLNADRTVSGQVSANVRSLADLEPVLGVTLSGALDASVSLSHNAGRQMIEAQISASGAALPGVVELEQAGLELQLSDLLVQPQIVARLEADGLRAGDLALDRAVVTADGGLESLDFVLDFTAKPLAANGRGQVAFADGETWIDVAALSARYADTEAVLAGPARIILARDLLDVDSLVLRAEGGRLSVNGRYGERSDLNVTLSGVPLELARLAAPDLDLSGRLDGEARLTGTRTAPRLSGDLTATGVTLAAVRKAGIAGLDVKSKIDWDAAALSAETIVSGGFGGSLEASARLSGLSAPVTGLSTLDAGSNLTGRLSGSVRLDVLNDLLAARGDRVEGTVAIDLSLNGRLAEPRIAGTLALTDGSYRGPLTGISLDDISMRLNGDGHRLTIADLSASTPNGGTVRARGGIGLDAGFPADISVDFGDALVVDNDLISAEVAGTVAVTGEITRALNLAGRLQVAEAEIRLPERLPPSIQTLEVEEINVPPELSAQRSSLRPTATGMGVPLNISLDLALDAPGRVFVRGRGIDAEVAGEITVRGNVDAPDMAGGFQLRRGHLDALGRRFSFSEGIVTLPKDGSVDVDIRFVARAKASDVSAQITVTGRASSPQIQVESAPELPQDEILARILFGKRSDSLSALESIQLARSAFQLTGMGSSPDLLGGVGSRLGLDSIDIQRQDNNAGPSPLNLRRRIAEGIRLGVQRGLQAGSGRATVELELMPNVSVETEVGVNNTGRVGIGMEWEY